MLGASRARGGGGGSRASVVGPLLTFVMCVVSAWLGFTAGRSTVVVPPTLPSSGLDAALPGAAGAAGTRALAASAAAPPSSPPSAAAAYAKLSMCHKRLSTRGELASYMDELGLAGEGVEVGVRDGDFSVWTLTHWTRGTKLHLVDPWLAQDSSVYNDVSNVAQTEQNARHDLVLSTMQSKFPGRFEIHRTFSVEASKKFADGSLVYVYIDARHDYKGVVEDLEAWWPKLAQGGVFSGHDWVPDGIHKQGDFGVQGAVFNFAAKVGREVQSISDKNKDGGRKEPQDVDGGWTTFYFIK